MIGIPSFLKPKTGTHDYVDAGGEQTIIEITSSKDKFISGIMFDMVNITKDGTFKFYSKVDGTNYREVTSQVFTVATDSDGILVSYKFPVNIDFKLTYEEDSDEGADRDIPFSYILEN